MDGKASWVGWGTWMAMGICLLLGLPAWAKYGGGSGTADDPYLIATAEQMGAIGLNPDDWDKQFKLVADLDMKGFAGSAFHPVGLFRGVFDGDGHTIANLTLAITGAEDTLGGDAIAGLGLFGSIQGLDATVKNLGLVNPEVRPTFQCPQRLWCVGALAGRVWSGSIHNCYVEGGQVQGERWVGGLVGSSSGTISDCHTTCVVQPGPQRPLPAAPGQWGRRELFGGLVGETYDNISNCWSAGNVQGKGLVGGLIGHNQEGAVMRCYATGRVRGETKDGLVSGLVCTADPALAKGCFWDAESSGLTTSDGGTGKTTAEMQNMWTYVAVGWDFVGEPYNGTEDIWEMPSGGSMYPKLAWEQMPAGDVILRGVPE
jgi:hypothetical protein